MSRRISHIAILLLFPTLASAQYGYITGKVYDKFGALGGVNVTIKDRPFGTFTDNDGYYAFELDTGFYTLEIKHTGYQDEEVIVKLENLDQLQLDFDLQGNLLNADVGIGSKSNEVQNQLESPVPIDVVYGSELVASGRVTLSNALHYILPNFYGVRESTSQGLEFVDPISIRGLAPDQVLVLVNGKRRHKSAYLHINQQFGRGTAGTDLNMIPIMAVDRIEILRDGASSQYGSDAIAGVINIVLKEETGSPEIVVSGGSSTEGDGGTKAFGFNYGFNILKRGFLNLTGSFTDRNAINRSGDYTSTIFNDARDNDQASRDAFFAQTGFGERRIISLGGGDDRRSALMYNMGFEVSDAFQLYSFGDFSYRQGVSKAIYRLPAIQSLVVPEIFPLGFAPEIHSDIVDRSVVIGLKGEVNNWFIDFGYNYGENDIDISVFNSNNASLGVASPISAFAGGYKYTQNVVNIDATRSFTIGTADLDLTTGTEFRLETYDIISGELTSFENGGDSTALGVPKVSGIQGFHGISGDEQIEELRSNASLYVEIDYETDFGLFLEAAGRYESYSDFGDRFNYKVSGRYKFANPFLIRGSISTGFKSPNLPQLFYKRISTELDETNARLVKVANFNSESAVAKAFGLPALEPELSETFSFGITSSINRNLSLSIDAYQINISNRIVLSSRIAADQAPVFASALAPSGVEEAEFFTNALDTKTSGVDALLAFNYVLPNVTIDVTSALSVFDTDISGSITGKGIFEGREAVLLNREERDRLESAVPSSQWRTKANIAFGKLSLTLQGTRFGQVQFLHPEDNNPNNWIANTFTGQVESRDQIFEAKYTFDADLSYNIGSGISLSVGALNLFNTLPDQHDHSGLVVAGFNTYSTKARQYDLTGAFIYSRLQIRL